jgi:TRAP-type C4-dicarboxylate transport system permease small subunit
VLFSVLVAIITYELDTVLYLTTAPAKLIDMSVLTAALPFITAAVLSFILGALVSRAINSVEETEKQETETQTKPEEAEEANLEETPS